MKPFDSRKGVRCVLEEDARNQRQCHSGHRGRLDHPVRYLQAEI